MEPNKTKQQGKNEAGGKRHSVAEALAADKKEQPPGYSFLFLKNINANFHISLLRTKDKHRIVLKSE